MKREDVYAAIDTERLRQERLHPGETCSEELMIPEYKLTILMEEVGEVARAILDYPSSEFHSHLQKELTEVAAVAVAWLESMEAEGEG